MGKPNFRGKDDSAYFVLGKDDMARNNIYVDEESYMTCAYCMCYYKIHSFAGHFQKCKDLLQIKGLSEEQIEEKDSARKEKRQKKEKLKERTIPNYGIKRNEKRWLNEIKAELPDPTYVPAWLDVSEDNPLYWDKAKFPQFNDLETRKYVFQKIVNGLANSLKKCIQELNKPGSPRERHFKALNKFKETKVALHKPFRDTGDVDDDENINKLVQRHFTSKLNQFLQDLEDKIHHLYPEESDNECLLCKYEGCIDKGRNNCDVGKMMWKGNLVRADKIFLKFSEETANALAKLRDGEFVVIDPDYDEKVNQFIQDKFQEKSSIYKKKVNKRKKREYNENILRKHGGIVNSPKKSKRSTRSNVNYREERIEVNNEGKSNQLSFQKLSYQGNDDILFKTDSESSSSASDNENSSDEELVTPRKMLFPNVAKRSKTKDLNLFSDDDDDSYAPPKKTKKKKTKVNDNYSSKASDVLGFGEKLPAKLITKYDRKQNTDDKVSLENQQIVVPDKIGSSAQPIVPYSENAPFQPTTVFDLTLDSDDDNVTHNDDNESFGTPKTI